MGPNLGGGWDTTDWGTLDYYRPGGTYGDIGDLSPLTFARYINPIPNLLSTHEIVSRILSSQILSCLFGFFNFFGFFGKNKRLIVFFFLYILIFKQSSILCGDF